MSVTMRSDADAGATAPPGKRLIYRQSAWTRATHWLWAICLFFLLLSGLQIFNAHPALYIGDESGFAYDNAVLTIGAERTASGPAGFIDVLGTKFETTGVLGLTGEGLFARARAFPAWATIPSGYDLATGRVVHFFFAWLLAGTLLIWAIASAVNGHMRRDLAPRLADLKALPRDIADHARFRFHHGRSYSPLQKLAYGSVLFVMLPLMIATGLAMSPGFNATAPWLVDVLGGRQTARTIHFAVMVLLVGFFITHILMIVAAGPINELRSIVTGWYRADADPAEGGDNA